MDKTPGEPYEPKIYHIGKFNCDIYKDTYYDCKVTIIYDITTPRDFIWNKGNYAIFKKENLLKINKTKLLRMVLD